MFALACVGIPDMVALEGEVDRLRKVHRLQGMELKSTQIKAKPRFVSDLAEFILAKDWPVFIELVDKHYFIIVNIVERLVYPYVTDSDFSANAMRVKNEMADTLAVFGPDELAQLYALACQSQKRPDAQRVYERIVKWARLEKSKDTVPHWIGRFTKDSLRDFKKLSPQAAVKQTLPIPDRTKKDGLVWILPNISSFTSIYARLNHHLAGSVDGVTFIHDEQVHFDEIIGTNKVVAEELGDKRARIQLRNADYDFRQIATLTFRNSKASLGIQVADVFAGFVSRYVFQKVWEPESITPDHDEAFELVHDFTKPGTATGTNYVVPSSLLTLLGKVPVPSY